MKNEEKTYDLFKFEDGDFSLDVMVSFTENTVWLTQDQISILFGKAKSTINEHIKNIFLQELNESEVSRKFGKTELSSVKTKPITYYNLDLVSAVGYRVNSKRGTLLKIWADSILNNNTTNDDYIIQNMPRISEKYQLVKFEDGDFSLDVSVSPNEDTVWLSLDEIGLLFERDRSVIGRHIKSIYSDDELDKNRTWAKNARVLSDGRIYNVDIYNLDIILAVGYKVNSKRGILFRQWANSVLKQYLIRGSVINEERCLSCTSNILSLQNDYRVIKERLDNLEESIYSSEKIIYEGEILEPYTFIRKLFFLAKREITIIDQYADKFLLSMLSDIKVKIEIVTSSNSYLNKEIITDNITIIHNDTIHDRFIIIDDVVYNIGTSINSIGKGMFVMIKMNSITKETILKNSQ